MKNHISVIIKKKDFESSNFMSNTDCALARALKRNGVAFESVGGTEVRVSDDTQYYIFDPFRIINTYNKYPTEDLQVELLLI